MLYIGVAADAHKLRRDLPRGEDQVYDPGGDGRARHPVVLCALGLLCDRDSSHRFNFAQPDGAVRGGSGQDNSNRTVLRVLGQRPEKEIDRHGLPLVTGTRDQVQLAFLDPHIRIRRDDVNVIRLQKHAIADLNHGESRRRPKKMRKNALMLCGQMLNEHDRHASAFLEGMQELSERFESTGRGADSHNCRRFGVGNTMTPLTGRAVAGARHRRQRLDLSTSGGGRLAGRSLLLFSDHGVPPPLSSDAVY